MSCTISGFLNFHVSYLNHDTFKLCLQNTLNMSKNTKVYFGVLHNWIEKASLEHIRRLLEITEVERNHELLLMLRNFRELGASPFPYIIPIVPHSLPTELIEREHFVFADLFNLNPGSSSQEDQAEAAKRTLVMSARATQPQSPQPRPRLEKKKEERKKTRARQMKSTGVGLEDFVNWMSIIAN